MASAETPSRSPSRSPAVESRNTANMASAENMSPSPSRSPDAENRSSRSRGSSPAAPPKVERSSSRRHSLSRSRSPLPKPEAVSSSPRRPVVQDRSRSASLERSPSPSRSNDPRRSPSPTRSVHQDRSPSPSRSRSPRRSPPRPVRDRSPLHRDNRSPPRNGRSPPRRRSPPGRREADNYRPGKKARSPPPPVAPKSEEDKLAAARTEYQKLLNLRSQGTYIPPHRLRLLQASLTDPTTKEYQRMAWDALKKSLNGLVNKVNVGNIKHLVPELFGENLVRGRGLFCQSILKAQHSSLPFTPIYACLIAIVNTKLPQIGELLVKRLVMRFRKAFKRNDKAVCISSTTFISHLVNTQVVHELLAAQILLLLLQKPTDDSVEIAVNLMREVGLFLEEMNPAIANAVYDRFRTILQEADIDRRAMFMVEVLFQTRKDRYKDNPVIREELDLVEEEDQITHRVGLDDDIDVQDGLNVFRLDPNWKENEDEYAALKAEILGEGSDDEDEDDASGSESEEDDKEVEALEIKDQTNADLVNLRRTIYLTIQSSADPEEAAHKLLRLRLPPGQEPELVSMLIESCAQEKTYIKFHGILAERFARFNRLWRELLEESFGEYYEKIHRYETSKLRNIAQLFGFLLAQDAIGHHVLSVIHLNEEETTAASRIFIKILFECLQENMGIAKLKTRLGEETLKPYLEGLFPHDNPKHIRFAINYFTSIKMGYLTEEMREFLANMPKPALPAPPKEESDSRSVSSYSSYTGSSYSSRSRSRTPPPRTNDRGRSVSRTPPRRIRDRSYSGSRGRSYSRSPPSRSARDSRSYSSRGRSYSRSRSVSSRRSISRSRSVRSRRKADSRSPSRSASPPPRHTQARRDSRDRSYSRSLSRSRSRSPSRTRPLSRSRSPLPYRHGRSGRSVTRSPSRGRDRSYSRSPPPPSNGLAGGRRRRAASYSASPSPPPAKRRRNSSSSTGGGRRSPSPPPRRRSRSPPPKRGRAAY